MTTIGTTGVEKDLKDLKGAVSAVVKANKAWLSALEAFFVNPKGMTDSLKQEIVELFKDDFQSPQIDQAVREVLDDVRFVQYADKRLDARISRSDPTPESLGRAVAEAYLVLTNEAYHKLVDLSTRIIKPYTGPDNDFKNFREKLEKLKPPDSGSVRHKLRDQVKLLLSAPHSKEVTLPPPEPTGTDLLLGRRLNPCSEVFLGFLEPKVSIQDFTRTLALLEGQHLTLSDSQIKGLTNSWGKAVTSFVRDSPPQAKTVQELESQEFTSLDTIAKFLCVHSVLETLYDRLETRVTRTDEDILSPDI